jgi:excinuclease ABC subunit C
MRDRQSELEEIPGIGSTTRKRLLQHFGSLKAVRDADEAALAAVVNKKQAAAIRSYFTSAEGSSSRDPLQIIQ